MPFDAQAARALARRTHGAEEILADLKRAIVGAAHQGDFAVTLYLPESELELVPPGQSVNTAGFLVEHLHTRGLTAWAEAVEQAVRAAYAARPSWRPVGMGAACDGVTVTWSLVVDEPEGPLRLMSAAAAYRMSMAARAQEQWVEKALHGVRRAAAQGMSSLTLRDAAPRDADVWPRRRDLLQNSGFATELITAEKGADLVIRW